MKTVNLNLLQVPGGSNAYALLAAFRRQARREKWTAEEIEAVTKEAQSGSFDNLVNVLLKYCDYSVESDLEEMGPSPLLQDI